MKIFIAFSSLIVASMALPQLQENMEAKFVSMLFNNYCGSTDSQPTCTCEDSSTFLHPYYIRDCDDGSEPLSCVCPTGSFFPATEEQMKTGESASRQSSNMEAKFVSMLFNNYCGSTSSQPTCTCEDSSTFLHPYYIKDCTDGSEPLSCICPDGSFFPATEEQMKTGEAASRQSSNMEAKFVSMLFNNYCSSISSQPTCTCEDSSTFIHPYYIKDCTDGSEPLSCVCPDGSFFPATEEQMKNGEPSSRSCVPAGQACNFVNNDCCSGLSCMIIWDGTGSTQCQ